jgi:hypothetical protein
VRVTLNQTSASVFWHPAAARAGTSIAAYRVTDTTTGTTIDTPASTTRATFDGLSSGEHTFTVTVLYAGGAAVVSTPSPTVVVE